MRTEVNREDVEPLLESAVGKARPLLVADVTDIDERLKAVTSMFGLPSAHTERLRRLFQLESIAGGKEFRKGFAGIVLTAAVGRLLDSGYAPAADFYSINPRPLFEKHIRRVLAEKYDAPMGKSDVLNVAKNARVIDAEWAKGRRPEDAAMAAVELFQWVGSAPEKALESLLAVLAWIYLSLGLVYGQEISAVGPSGDLYADVDLLVELIRVAPAGGATAQAVVGSLLQAQHHLFSCDGALEGVEESVYATNTTSKKAGDFAESLQAQLRIYEVTTKPVDRQRVDESAASVLAYVKGLRVPPEHVEVTFLCDPKTVDPALGGMSIVHRGVRYQFVAWDGWVQVMMERLGPIGRSEALESVRDYVGHRTTQLTVKKAWQQLMQAGSKER